MTTLVAVITDYELYTREYIQEVCRSVDACEFRLDYLEGLNINKLAMFKQLFTVPIIFTLRKKSHGGKYKFPEEKRLSDIEYIASLQPDYIDIECDTDAKFVEYLHKKNPNIKLISSYHNFDKTPAQLENILSDMLSDSIYSYKIATYANSSLDTLRMLRFVRNNSSKLKLTGICMGNKGKFGRILSPIFGGHFCYSFSAKENITAPGQAGIEELLDTYNFRELNGETRIYCLIGDPVEYSKGDIFHNLTFSLRRSNSVYVKINLLKNELNNFIDYFKEMKFYGASVTMPLKEQILHYIDDADEDVVGIGSLNTIVVHNERLLGFNTDGVSVIDLIQQKHSVKGKRIIVLGAGGTAKSMVFHLKRCGGLVSIANRTIDKANHLATKHICEVVTFVELSEKLANNYYDIFINATSLGMFSNGAQFPVSIDLIASSKLVVDFVYGGQTRSLQEACINSSAIYIAGKDIFLQQAAYQNQLWERYS